MAAWEAIEQHWDEMLLRWPQNTMHRVLEQLPALVAAGDDAVQRASAWLDSHPVTRGELKVRQSRERLHVNQVFKARVAGQLRGRAHRLGARGALTPAVSGGHPRSRRWPLRVFAVDDCSAQLTWRASPAEDLTIEVGDSVAHPLPSPPVQLVLDAPGRARPLDPAWPAGAGAVVLDGLSPATTYDVVAAGRGVPRFRAGRLRTLAVPGEHLLCRFATVSDVHIGERRFGVMGRIHDALESTAPDGAPARRALSRPRPAGGDRRSRGLGRRAHRGQGRPHEPDDAGRGARRGPDPERQPGAGRSVPRQPRQQTRGQQPGHPRKNRAWPCPGCPTPATSPECGWCS